MTDDTGGMETLHRRLTEILQTAEDELLIRSFDDITVATQSGSWSWQTIMRARELSKPPEGGEPTEEEYDMAVRLIAASPQDHAKLSELIAREFARRRA